MAKDTEISENVEQINTLIEQLKSGDHSKSTGEELFQEGQGRLAKLRELVNDGDGEIIELD
ncbi:exodeoxyribonuclease VII small subunit [Haladaptatus sp. NG-WS-4]